TMAKQARPTAADPATTARNVAAMRAMYAAYGRKNPQPFFDLLSPAVQFCIAAPRAQFRFAGPKRGKAAVQRVITQIAEDYDWQTFAAREVIAAGDRVIGVSGGRLKHRTSGAVMTVELVDVVRLKNGKIVEFTEYFDTARVLALQGHDLSPPAARVRTARRGRR
ncbi:MAG: nuclear transport factor 2 family protein, partial [Proteobacteria bacterium]|nr:nuclear transport factor 2 family protein [Pseudomonadota bacterium]